MPFEKEEAQTRSYGNGILRPFEKTPPSIVCPHFWELNWGYGCPYDCSYCYLQGTFRGNTEPRPRKLSRVFSALESAFEDGEDGNLEPTVFNSGELADSILDPSKMEEIADKFEEQDKHKLLLLTKSRNVKFLTDKPRNHTIVSFSLNASKLADMWESPPAPSPKERINAAKQVCDAGYETRIRIDPMAPVNGWEDQYCSLVDDIFSSLEPERITLGSLRGLQKTITFCKDDSWTKYLTEGETGWGKKVKKADRLSMYSVVKNYLEDEYAYSGIALCKETPEIWKELGMNPGSPPDWEGCKCNCVW